MYQSWCYCFRSHIARRNRFRSCDIFRLFIVPYVQCVACERVWACVEAPWTEFGRAWGDIIHVQCTCGGPEQMSVQTASTFFCRCQIWKHDHTYVSHYGVTYTINRHIQSSFYLTETDWDFWHDDYPSQNHRICFLIKYLQFTRIEGRVYVYSQLGCSKWRMGPASFSPRSLGNRKGRGWPT